MQQSPDLKDTGSGCVVSWGGCGFSCVSSALREPQRGVGCINGSAAGLCAVGCSDADGDGQYRADVGYFLCQRFVAFMYVLQDFPAA